MKAMEGLEGNQPSNKNNNKTNKKKNQQTHIESKYM